MNTRRKVIHSCVSNLNKMIVLNKFILFFLLTVYIQSAFCELFSKSSNELSDKSSSDENDEFVFGQIVCEMKCSLKSSKQIEYLISRYFD